jgi:hypothetical protein
VWPPCVPTALEGGPPTGVDCLCCARYKPDIIFDDEYVLFAPHRDGLPSFDVGSGDRNFLARHGDRLVRPKAYRQSSVRLDKHLAAKPVVGIDVRRRGDLPSIARIYCGEAADQGGERIAGVCAEAPELAQRPAKASGLPIEVHHKDTLDPS